MSALIIYICAAVFISFLCSMLEATILSITPTQIGLLKKSGSKSAELLRSYKEGINLPLTSILTLNTAANMIGAAGVGAEVSKIYGDSYLGLASSLLTIIILLFSEILPKTLGSRYSYHIAPYAAYIILILSWLFYPIFIISDKMTNLIPVQKEEHLQQVKEELIVSVELGHDTGKLLTNESTMLKNLLTLDRMRVADIMTQRSHVIGCQKDQKAGQVLDENKNMPHSRLPVYCEDLDDIIGVVHKYTLLESRLKQKDHQTVGELASKVYFISQSTSVANALDQFIKTKQHLFIVMDSYGSTSGILTLEDAIESLLGEEIIDEYDLEDEDQRIQILTKDKRKFIIKKKDS